MRRGKPRSIDQTRQITEDLPSIVSLCGGGGLDFKDREGEFATPSLSLIVLWFVSVDTEMNEKKKTLAFSYVRTN